MQGGLQQIAPDHLEGNFAFLDHGHFHHPQGEETTRSFEKYMNIPYYYDMHIYIYTQFFIKITYISIKHIKRMEDELDSFFFQNKLKPAALSFKFPWKDIKIWRLPKMGVSPNHPFQWIFHEININKPSNLGYPPFQETSIFINLHAENPAQSVAVFGLGGPQLVDLFFGFSSCSTCDWQNFRIHWNLVGGFNPSEKYESQLGWLATQYMGKF